MRLALIPCAPTEWEAQGRLLGRAELAPAPGWEALVARWADVLRPAGLTRIVHSTDQLATRTARSLARLLGIPHRRQSDLDEVDLGLWTGLTHQQLETRFGSAHRQLCEAPLSVTAPDGESLSAAAARIARFLVRRLKSRRPEPALGVVLRPLVWALARGLLEGGGLERVWAASRQRPEPLVIEVSQVPALLVSGPSAG